MNVKDREIQIGRTDNSHQEADCFIIDEYGIEEEKIFHRYIMISDYIFTEFQKDPDNDIHLNEFLKRHDIYVDWKPFNISVLTEEHDQNLFTKLLDDMKLDLDVTKWSEQTKQKAYQQLYDQLTKKETLINNPLIIDVFNEALKEERELGRWESVFPFFE